MTALVLSLFPGIDLLGRAFEEQGYCVVRGPELFLGQDIRDFHPPRDVFWGVIGGPPCQDFSPLRRDPPTGNGQKMLAEFARCVTEAQPEWWLMENVSRVPDVTIRGYNWQRLDIDLKWFCDCSRLRHIQFGSKSGRLINVTKPVVTNQSVTHTAALANDDRDWTELSHIQGVSNIELPLFTVAGKKRAIGNGVPLPMGRALASAVTAAYSVTSPDTQTDIFGVTWPGHRLCPCGCGRPVTGRATYAADENGNTAACRKRAQRRRDKANPAIGGKNA